ncbi:hypothetical protein G7074_11950 [Pedobacter sp. HDW13]|uniref:hypothetical protein n=1 Tax=unclassified Pedobacter TaxID=2628915 RepID=UPI000F59E265|nr:MULTISPECIES: hypothetical protein [unclassified Pedobacter]QIL39915.1 hypothetical protein G7074_11950 [Pedobacter sp. HDW13]RQO79593.1 hypothetical protein DBR40_01135 [Pedobacter sp. KBW01]
MKKLFLILTLCMALGCKKKNDAENTTEITKYNWALESATVSPAMQIEGKAVTNFMTMSGPSGCLNNNYTLSFSENGTFAITSTGPLCDMISYQNAKWSKKGSEITLNDGFSSNARVVKIEGKNITDKYVFEQNGTTFTVTYIFTAKSK